MHLRVTFTRRTLGRTRCVDQRRVPHRAHSQHQPLVTQDVVDQREDLRGTVCAFPAGGGTAGWRSHRAAAPSSCPARRTPGIAARHGVLLPSPAPTGRTNVAGSGCEASSRPRTAGDRACLPERTGRSASPDRPTAPPGSSHPGIRACARFLDKFSPRLVCFMGYMFPCSPILNKHIRGKLCRSSLGIVNNDKQ